MRRALTLGLYPDAKSWCHAVLKSPDTRIPGQWRWFAVWQLLKLWQDMDEENRDPLEWARLLKAKEELGIHLCFAQRDAWRNALLRAGEEVQAGRVTTERLNGSG